MQGLESAPCPMGCPPGDVPVLTGPDRLHATSTSSFAIVQCASCDTMRTNPRPTPEAIGDYYPTAYSPHTTPMAPKPARFQFLDGIDHLVPPAKPTTAFEIGCASGRMLGKLRDRGWRVSGVEPSPEATQLARNAGFDVFCGRVEDMPDPEEKVGLVFASHVLEHLHDPASVLARTRTWARDDAWLAVSLPDASSMLFREFGADWYDLDLPRHLYHFTPETLGKLLAKCGWDVVKVKWDATMNSVMGSFGYRLREKLGDENPVGKYFSSWPDRKSITKPLMNLVAFGVAGLHQSGRMIVWARPS